VRPLVNSEYTMICLDVGLFQHVPASRSAHNKILDAVGAVSRGDYNIHMYVEMLSRRTLLVNLLMHAL
jgi:hypothetical protein